jgi:hypothetical protein
VSKEWLTVRVDESRLTGNRIETNQKEGVQRDAVGTSNLYA